MRGYSKMNIVNNVQKLLTIEEREKDFIYRVIALLDKQWYRLLSTCELISICELLWQKYTNQR